LTPFHKHIHLQVGFTMCVTGGRLAEELLEMLPDYELAFMGDEGPAAATAAAGEQLQRHVAERTTQDHSAASAAAAGAMQDL
jgi:hypothetical protein